MLFAYPFKNLRGLARAARLWVVVCGVFFSLLVQGAESKPFRFAWLTDTHVGSSGAGEDLQTSVRDINAQGNVDFVIISGDVTEYGSLTQFREAHAILQELKMPYHIIPGNHDTKWSESGATDFARVWDADRFVFDFAGYRFIGIHEGPLMKMGDGHWAPQDVRWLENQIKKLRKDQPVIFITHYPIDDGIANWFVVLDMLKKVNTQAVLCGHGHGNNILLFEGVQGVMGRSNLRAKAPVGGYNLVEVKEGKMTFCERNPGQETKPAWHSLMLQAPGAAPEGKLVRPDYSMNQEYADVRPAWSFNTGYTISSTPAATAELGIVGDASGVVRGFALNSGKTRWTMKTGSAVYSTPAISGEVVIVPSTDGSIYAVKAASGKMVWSVKTPRAIVASPAITNNVVYLGSSENKFRALEVKTGKLLWEFDGLSGFMETKPLLYDGKVIFGAWDQHLYALDARTGALVWKWKGSRPGTLLSPAACWPVGADGKVFIAAPDRFLTAIRAADGEQIWRTVDYTVRESIGLSEDGTKIYVRSMNNFFHSFATKSDKPEVVWSMDAKFGYDINSAMLVEKDGTVFYGTKNDVLYALDAASGTVKWKHKLGTGVMNTVLPLSASKVLVTDFDGTVALIQAGK